jgi:hypothetical protein
LCADKLKGREVIEAQSEVAYVFTYHAIRSLANAAGQILNTVSFSEGHRKRAWRLANDYALVYLQQ